eukprot:4712616-Prymnesium_polylepis.1
MGETNCITPPQTPRGPLSAMPMATLVGSIQARERWYCCLGHLGGEPRSGSGMVILRDNYYMRIVAGGCVTHG